MAWSRSQVIVEDKGAKTEWSLEGGSPNTLSRRGWRPTSFKPGDVVAVRLNPMKDGNPAGGFVGAKLARRSVAGIRLGRASPARVNNAVAHPTEKV
jgi:hypothetical protein